MEWIGPTLTCKKCGAELLEDSQFCHACGEKFIPNDECPSCHEKLVEGAKFCRKCGSVVESHEAPSEDEPRKFFSDDEVRTLWEARLIDQTALNRHQAGG